MLKRHKIPVVFGVVALVTSNLSRFLSELLVAVAVIVAAQVAGSAAVLAGSPGPSTPIAQKQANLVNGAADFELYLDRLMFAESGGRDQLSNPRSSALGPYQFIKGTFLWVVRRRFPEKVAGLGEPEILALRTDRDFSRMVIAEYTRELAQHLDRNDLPTTYGNLRLAYFLGPSGATSVLKAKPEEFVRELISTEAVDANPFLAQMTAQEIIARAHREISMDPAKRLPVEKRDVNWKPGEPAIKVQCNLALASCRRWLAMKKERLQKAAVKQAAGAIKDAAAR